ncbi:dihydrolipoyl dehydrogenase [Limobrevibacterium gyesilva]|uniref:Dihydrolipoyl dehydrogenase n=1 Tax=Limobrevibacterium gyesilva TaxID=2991712 RepID=A0AA41YK47_9PROT|nr:dihydrolipoyl dehydrogenase [Limobrevibacterium gyesilva]MCW3475259.1 dihydrolipoyl dehydrogenase [Limobrevibacterium gyesilva]
MIRTKVLVVGGGPGGYVAAIRAGQLGLETILVEAERLGGTCLIKGCIPSKALIHAAGTFEAMRRAAGGDALGIMLPEPPRIDLARTVRWKEGIVDRLNHGVAALLRKAKVRVIEGWATFSDAKTCTVRTAGGEESVRAEHVILANGSEPAFPLGLEPGGPVISSTEALLLDRLPERLLVVGAGYIGLELGTAFRKMGSDVTVVEARERVLPNWDEKLTNPVKRWLERAGVTLHLGASVEAVEHTGAEAVAIVRTGEGPAIRIAAEKVLVTVGRRPRTQGWGLEAMAVDMAGPFVRIDEQCRTSMRDVWAIGDLVGEPMLAHKASAQGELVAELIAGARRHFDPVAIPAVCFTEPEIVSVGLTPPEAEERGLDAIVGQFPFAASGRALSMEAGEDGGFVRVIARRDDHRLLGVQAVGAHVAELVGEFTLAMEMGALLEDVAGTIHAHPTLTEAFHEAALKGLGHAIHI